MPPPTRRRASQRTTSGSISRVCSRLYRRPGRGSRVRMNSTPACASSGVTCTARARSFTSRFCSRGRCLSTISAATSMRAGARQLRAQPRRGSCRADPASVPRPPAAVKLAKLLLLRRNLDQQALAQIARAYARRVEMLHQVDGAAHQVQSCLASDRASACGRSGRCWRSRGATAKARRQLLFARRQVPVFVQIADHELGRLKQIALEVRAPSCHAR
jgi:hypothetical protein